ncbi:hypothetical protein EGR_10942 [Echinococcus granulosus]|uniref:Uncharacterized protein n=1 Tax=Echinococcus granulosus TaxID=6210 RepID=W6TZM5_ECHGR|nr:hypothetical protein EGR_10942 [Echinococcus granulosus]EUB54198.1 hypothetical protein EGR_10942 [Echinococcus granulosus]
MFSNEVTACLPDRRLCRYQVACVLDKRSHTFYLVSSDYTKSVQKEKDNVQKKSTFPSHPCASTYQQTGVCSNHRNYLSKRTNGKN